MPKGIGYPGAVKKATKKAKKTSRKPKPTKKK